MSYRVFVASNRANIAGANQMQISLDYPGSWTDASEQVDSDVGSIPIFLAYGEISDAQYAALSADPNHAILIATRFDVDGKQLSTNELSKLSAPQIAAIKAYAVAMGVDLGKYPIDSVLAAGVTTRKDAVIALKDLVKAAK